MWRLNAGNLYNIRDSKTSKQVTNVTANFYQKLLRSPRKRKMSKLRIALMLALFLEKSVKPSQRLMILNQTIGIFICVL